MRYKDSRSANLILEIMYATHLKIAVTMLDNSGATTVKPVQMLRIVVKHN